MGPYVAAAAAAAAFSQTIHSSVSRNISSHSHLKRPLKMRASSVVILWGWTVTTTLSTSATSKAPTPLRGELRVKLEEYRKCVFATFKIIATLSAGFIEESGGYLSTFWMVVFNELVCVVFCICYSIVINGGPSSALQC